MKKLFFALFLFFLCCFLGEQYFNKNYKPGYQTHYTGFNIVDSLIIYEDYHTDVFGNYVLNPLVTDSLKVAYNFGDCNIKNAYYVNRISNVDGISKILGDFCALKHLKTPTSEFELYAAKLLQQTSLTEADSACLAYINYPFNAQGFRSIAFDNYPSEKIKVLIIGDSFVWGMSAKPYYNSFVDLLLARNMLVFNAGISSIDPIQYLSICKIYVDSIEPDLVIVNFYEGNDVMNKERIHAENRPHEHITNAGFFESNPEGQYLTAQEAYAYFENQMRIPQNTFINKLLGKTALGSVFWTLTHPNQRYRYSSQLTQEEGIAYTKTYIDSIAYYLNDKELPYFFTITPDESGDYNKNKTVLGYDTSKVKQVFDDLEYYIPNNLTHEDYNEPKDIHLNNAGSLKYANFIDSLIKIKLSNE